MNKARQGEVPSGKEHHQALLKVPEGRNSKEPEKKREMTGT